MNPVHDVARIRLDNTMLLFDEFVQAAVKHPDAAALRGLERRFAEKLQIQPSYWSQIKGRSRQIGERLARQFELLCRKPVGWMDLPHDTPDSPQAAAMAAAPHPGAPPASPSQPQDDDERFIVGLVLTYYRRHPQRARTRLLDLLGEVLTPPAVEPSRAAAVALTAAAKEPRPAATPVADDLALWARSKSGVAPLKPKR